MSKEKRGTREFADAIIERLDQSPSLLKPVVFNNALSSLIHMPVKHQPAKRELAGVDIFLQASDRNSENLAKLVLQASDQLLLQLQMITNRGTKVWPNGFPETFCTDHWRCRFKTHDARVGISYDHIVKLIERLNGAGLDIIKTENLYYFDGQPGFTAAQGQ